MIPYNPSSFDTNKTILEQILELKNWLKDHPSYRVFVSTENGNTTMSDTYDLNQIVDDPSELGPGDAVLFNNGCVGSVSSVDFDAYTFDCNTPCVNIKGPQGPSGHNGVSVTGATIDGSGHLIVTLSNGNTIDAGMAKGADGTNGTNGTNGEDGSYVSAATVDGSGDLQITIYDPATSTSSTINAGHVVGPAGQGMQIINTTTSTGTLSASDLAKANGTDDCIVIFTDNGADLTMQRILKDSSYVYFYAHFVDTGKASFLLCEVDAVTGAYNIDGGDLPIKASNIDSDSATNGQVLTADGNGGASWQNASGGTTLNHYTYTGTNRTIIGNIIKNAKGNVTFRINIQLTIDNYTFNIGLYAVEDNSGILYLHYNGSQVRGTNSYYIFVTYSLDQTCNWWAFRGDGTNLSGTVYVNPNIVYISYYNDTEILS